ncbi:MAG: hypothetical protein ISR65_04260 [Bacteriovoracaceae bacterium]|nr:hypothetical protein [Bacteriovoracaceae bacterium]
MRNLKLFLLFAVLYSYSVNLVAAPSMRRCLLLPINDKLGGAIGYRVYEKVEEFIKDSDWCYYISNSEILNILGHYRKNLSHHLENTEVLRIIADKTNTGSLIKVDIINQVDGVDIQITVFGNVGDIYFKEKTKLKSNDIELIAQTIKNWLDVYQKVIPYDGRITGILGKQFVTDMGKGQGAVAGDMVNFVRPISVKKHPLLKEVVEWKVEKVGLGKIYHTTDSQSHGTVTKIRLSKKLRNGDWARLIRKSGRDSEFEKQVQGDAYKFGKLGTASIVVNLGKLSDTITLNNSTNNKMGGLSYGVLVKGELWITRKFWTSFQIGKQFSTMTKEDGSLSQDENSAGTDQYKLKLGYRYLPLGFFYGPQIDGYVGYGRYGYSVEPQLSDGIVESSFTGIILGTKGSIPLRSKLRLYVEFDIILFPALFENRAIPIESSSVSSYHFELGASWTYKPNISIDGSLDIISNEASFDLPVRQVSFQQTTLKMGATFTY